MRTPTRTRLAVGALLVSLSISAATSSIGHAALAQPSAADKDTARKLMDKGDAAMAGKDYNEALKAYQGAQSLIDVPTTALAVAQAQVGLGLYLEARDTALHVERLPAAPNEDEVLAQARKDAAALAADMDKRIPSIEVKVMGTKPDEEFKLTIDGALIPAAAQTLPRRVNPGEHSITVEAKGYATNTSTIKAPEGDQTIEVPVEMKVSTGDGSIKPVDPGGKKIHLLLPIGAAVTGVGLAVGIGTGVAALNTCTTKGCALGWVANVGFIVAVGGAAMGVAGLVLTLNSPSQSEAAPAEPAKEARVTLQPILGPTFAGVSGTFF